MKKVIVSFFFVSMLIVSMSMSAFAATTADGSKITGKISSIQAIQQKISNKIASADAKLQKLAGKQFKNPIRQKVNEDTQTLVTNKNANLTSVQQVNDLRLAIQEKLASIKQNGTTIPTGVLTQIKDNNSQIKSIMGAIKDSKGQVKSILKSNKNNLKNKDLQSIEDTFSHIYSIQNASGDQINQITGLLQNISDLLQTVQ